MFLLISVIKIQKKDAVFSFSDENMDNIHVKKNIIDNFSIHNNHILSIENW